VNTIISWLKSKNITSHTVAVAAIFLATLISTDQQVRDFVLTIFKAHPSLGADIILLATVILKYTRSSSAAGTVAQAIVIESSPKPPTQADVNAADTTTK
jgi:hypothetical protein